jgi:hypothetical protein
MRDVFEWMEQKKQKRESVEPVMILKFLDVSPMPMSVKSQDRYAGKVRVKLTNLVSLVHICHSKICEM